MITPSATNPNLTNKGLPNVFRTCGRDDQQGQVAANYISGHLKHKKIAVLNDKTTYGKGLADATLNALTRSGVTPILVDGLNAGEKDYSAIISRLKSVGVEVIYWGGNYPEAGLLRRQMSDQGVNAIIMGGDGIANSEFAQVGGPGVEGSLMTFAPDPRKKPAAAEVVKAFEAQGFDPQAYTLYSYAAVEVLTQAAEAAKSIDPKKVEDYIHSGAQFHTVLGDLSYDKNGDLSVAKYTIYRWVKSADGKLTYQQDD